MMKNISLLVCILVVCLLVSCAHKSGHTKNKEYFQSKNVRTSSKQVNVVADEQVWLDIEGSRDNRRKLDGAQIFARYNTAVFMVFTSDGWNVYQGSGFFVNKSGLAVSNYHVFKDTGIGEEGIKLIGSDEIYKVAEVIQCSEKEDFILFRVSISNTNYIPVAPNKPHVGDKVFAIGSPRGLENTFSSGEVSQWRAENKMQISALIDHGSSGGALINEYGEVVGITSGTFYDGSQANLNYAWSIDVIKPFVNIK